MLFGGAAAPAATAAQVWDTLGNVRLKPGGWESTVEVLQSAVLNEIRIDVDGGDLDMQDLRLAFDNGTVWSSGTRLKFREGSRSNLVKLPDASHRVRRVGFTYKSLTPGGAPLVQVYGRLAAQPTAEVNWIHVGGREVDFTSSQGAIESASEDTSRALRFWVDNNEVDLSNVKVTYSNGETVTLPGTLSMPLRKGRVVELPGAGGVVRRIEFTYHSPFKETPAQSKSLIHVYGRP